MSAFEIMDVAAIARLEMADPQLRPAYDNALMSKPALSLAKHDGIRLLASVSLFCHQTPKVDGRSCYTLGHLYGETEALGLEAIKAGLTQVPKGAPILGPMDANTWFAYRAITDFGTEPTFFLEKPMAAFWPDVFKQAGFKAVATYRSAMTARLDYEDRSAKVWAEKLPSSGLTVRRFDTHSPEADLRALYALSCVSFSHNLFYTPISETDFLALYQPVLKYLVADFVWLAFEGDDCVGFVFAMPDLNQAQRGETVDTLIIKTLAVKPGRTFAGLGAYLGWWVHQCALKAGFKKAIHAYMYEGNRSRIISDKSASLLRLYELYGR